MPTDTDDDSEWPKEWSSIANGRTDTWLTLDDGIRSYDGTMYVSPNFGTETDAESDLWMPFSAYVNREIRRALDQHSGGQ